MKQRNACSTGLGRLLRLGLGLVVLPTVVACGTVSGTVSTGSSSGETESGETTTESTASDYSSMFPSSLAVASPLSVSSSASASVSKSIGTGISSEYAAITAEIEAILSGTTPASCSFDPAPFLVKESNADCYGPTVDYVDHPDTGGTEDGELPVGDVGIWASLDPDTGHACASAQLDARIEGMQSKSLASLESMASLICVAAVNGIAPPSNSTVDLLAEMNALGIADTTFYIAEVSHSDASGSDQYSYVVDLIYAPGGTSHPIVVRMTHVPTSDPEIFQGRISYLVNDSSVAGNCSSSDITHNGSLLYNAAAADDMDLEMRTAEFCGSAVDGTVDGLVNPADKVSSTNLDGWGNSFNVFTANFDPTTLTGDYAFSWQAGPQDNFTRVFNIHADGASSSIPSGSAFFGYGADVDGTDGSINGFICNWAGPGSSHTLQDLAQLQTIEWDSASNLFVVTDEQIGYALTNSCEYDGTGTFEVDSDMDGAVDTDPAVAISNDLQALTDADVDGAFDEVEAVFTLPTAPPNL
ncbi:MAG: hypothetical protein HY696_03005 [Deltaproteobacteria bacterium]|nr:hypothetical protein [Deltaproteobacteria bacterium]